MSERGRWAVLGAPRSWRLALGAGVLCAGTVCSCGLGTAWRVHEAGRAVDCARKQGAADAAPYAFFRAEEGLAKARELVGRSRNASALVVAAEASRFAAIAAPNCAAAGATLAPGVGEGRASSPKATH